MTVEVPFNGMDLTFSVKGNIAFEKRAVFLQIDNSYFKQADEIEMVSFFKELALDPNILGVAFSSIRLGGGIFSHFFVRDFSDDKTVGKTLASVDKSLAHLEEALQQNAGAHSYVEAGDQSPSEFAVWFREEFHRPHEFGEDDLLQHFTEIAGSYEELELLTIVMFT